MAKKTKETASPKNDNKITISREDLPKQRDLNRVALIQRKKGAHKNVRKENDKKKCRQKVRQEND